MRDVLDSYVRRPDAAMAARRFGRIWPTGTEFDEVSRDRVASVSAKPVRSSKRQRTGGGSGVARSASPARLGRSVTSLARRVSYRETHETARMRQTSAKRFREPRRSEMSTDYEANKAGIRRTRTPPSPTSESRSRT
jgi:hypothetical protein